MRRRVALSLVLLLAVLPALARADGLVAPCTAGSQVSAPVPMQPYTGGDAQLWAVSNGANASVATLECRSYSTAPWYPCQSVTNVDATGKYYSLPWAFQYRWNIVYSGGPAVCGTIIAYKK